ncbi:MAG: hypothetical protein LWX07_02925 [Bacteroidetes bacterium]|nr:hypothetical protein [Bacteroidota bacterium]
MFKKYFTALKYVILAGVMGLSLTGTECEKLLNSTGSIDGSWTLVKMEGNLQDVCLGESANFANGVATLRCPGKSAVTRNYTYTNNVLTYSASGISYDVSFNTVNGVYKMILTASGTVDRKLTYDQN